MLFYVQIYTHSDPGPLFGPPPKIIVVDPEVIAACAYRAWAKFPIFSQLPSLYSAIVDVYWGEPPVEPPIIRTLSLVEVVAYSDILKLI